MRKSPLSKTQIDTSDHKTNAYFYLFSFKCVLIFFRISNNPITQNSSGTRSHRKEEMLRSIKAEKTLKLILTPKEVASRHSNPPSSRHSHHEQSREDLVEQDRMEEARQKVLMKMQSEQGIIQSNSKIFILKYYSALGVK